MTKAGLGSSRCRRFSIGTRRERDGRLSKPTATNFQTASTTNLAFAMDSYRCTLVCRNRCSSRDSGLYKLHVCRSSKEAFGGGRREESPYWRPLAKYRHVELKKLRPYPIADTIWSLVTGPSMPSPWPAHHALDRCGTQTSRLAINTSASSHTPQALACSVEYFRVLSSACCTIHQYPQL